MNQAYDLQLQRPWVGRNVSPTQLLKAKAICMLACSVSWSRRSCSIGCVCCAWRTWLEEALVVQHSEAIYKEQQTLQRMSYLLLPSAGCSSCCTQHARACKMVHRVI